MGNKKWTYHKTHTCVIDDEKQNFSTQLYQIGVYAILNGNARQLNLTPADIVKIESNLRKSEKEGQITNLVFGVSITVIEDENGLYKEIEDEKG